MQDWLSPTSLRLGKASELALLSFYVRLHLAQFLVAFVAQFGVALGGDEELLIYIFSIFTGIRSLWHFGLLGVPRKGNCGMPMSTLEIRIMKRIAPLN